MLSTRKQRIPSDALKAAAVLLVCFGWLFLALGAGAQNGLPKTKPTGYVNDFAGVLSQPARSLLTNLCTEVDQKAKAQIAVVTVKSLEGRPIEDYSIALATQWGIGPKQSASGVLILLAVDDRQDRVEVGYGLEPILPDGKVGGFLREAVPYLREGNYDAAMLLITRRVADVIAQDRGVTLSATTSLPAARTPQREQRGNGPSPIFVIIVIIFLVSLVANLIRRGGGRGGRGPGSGWWVGPMIGGMMAEVLVLAEEDLAVVAGAEASAVLAEAPLVAAEPAAVGNFVLLQPIAKDIANGSKTYRACGSTESRTSRQSEDCRVVRLRGYRRISRGTF